MTDEAPIDLRGLDPGISADLVRRAVRRFRWRVVLFTVLVVVVMATLVGWGTKEIVQSRNAARLRAEGTQLTATQAALATGGTNCSTPTYRVGPTQVILLQLAPMPSGGWAFHFAVGGTRSLTVDRQDSDGDVFPRRTSLAVTGPQTTSADVMVSPGSTWGDVYLNAPAASRDSQVAFDLINPRRQVAGSFLVDIARLTHC